MCHAHDRCHKLRVRQTTAKIIARGSVGRTTHRSSSARVPVIAVLPPHLAGTLRYCRHYPPMPCTLLCSLSPGRAPPYAPERSTVHRIVALLSLSRCSVALLCNTSSCRAHPSSCSLPCPLRCPLSAPCLSHPSSRTGVLPLPLCLPRPSCPSRPANELGSAALIQLPGLARIPRPPPLGRWQLSPTGQALTPVTRESDTAETDRAVQRSPECSSAAQPARRRKGSATLLAREACY